MGWWRKIGEALSKGVDIIPLKQSPPKTETTEDVIARVAAEITGDMHDEKNLRRASDLVMAFDWARTLEEREGKNVSGLKQAFLESMKRKGFVPVSDIGRPPEVDDTIEDVAYRGIAIGLEHLKTGGVGSQMGLALRHYSESGPR